ncbi:hypothetical protein OIO90_005285 [Microbotryomycetes sp. JL221]|nr:hypothetical protein OIO90_005285 [Microbotryomycetes sp. JL221]
MSASTFVITGANRGLGLALTQELLQRGHNVVAGARNPVSAIELNELKRHYNGRLELVALNVADTDSVNAASRTVANLAIAQDGIDVLVNNAGLNQGTQWNGLYSQESKALEDLKAAFEVNVYGVLRTNIAFLPLLRKKVSGKKQIIVISSNNGSLNGDYATVPIASAYAVTKTAVNTIVRKSHGELSQEGITIVSYHPGLIMTDMIKNIEPEKLKGLEVLTPEQAGSGAADVFEKLTSRDSAKFLTLGAAEIDW